MSNEFELNVLGLIGSLKNEINILRDELNELREKVENIKPGEDIEVGKMSINEVRDHIKDELVSIYPDLKFTNGNRSQGKLTISDGEKMIERVLIRTSKSYREDQGYASGWITFNKKLVGEYELYFFVVKDFEGKPHVFVLNNDDLKNWVSHKNLDSQENYHFYLNNIHGKWIDDREDDHYNFTHLYKNWGQVRTLLDSK